MKNEKNLLYCDAGIKKNTEQDINMAVTLEEFGTKAKRASAFFKNEPVNKKEIQTTCYR